LNLRTAIFARPASLRPRRAAASWLAPEAKFGVVLLLALSLLLLFSGSTAYVFACCYFLVLLIGGYAWFKLGTGDSRIAAFLPNIFAASFAIRSVAVMFLNVFLNSDETYDAYWYELFGMQWSNYWHHMTISRPIETYESEHLYSLVVGVQYFLSDNNTYVPLLTNAFIGALIPVVVYGIGRRALGGEEVGRAASVFACLQTSMIVWSAIAMRDIIIIFFLALIMRDVVAMSRRLTFWGIFRIFVWLGVIYAFRPYVVLFTVLSIGIAYSFILSKKTFNRILIGFAFIGILAAIVLVGGVRSFALSIVQSQTEQLDLTRQVVMFNDPHAYAPNERFNNIFDIIKFLPYALYNFWGGPFLLGYPIKEILVGLNGVVSWYVTYWYAFRGWLKIRGQTPATVPMVIYCAVGSMLLSIICGNWQECVRLRSMLSVPIELFAGVGWVRRKELVFSVVRRS
jgi:hypothetical protein